MIYASHGLPSRPEDAFWQKLHAKSLLQPDKLRFLCEAFLDVPYSFKVVGEGEFGRYDRRPLYRHDVFNCMSYVTTLLALYFSNSIDEFVPWYVRLQYTDYNVEYLKRHVFLETDWIWDNRAFGLRDINIDLASKLGVPIGLAQTTIDKTGWLLHHRLEDIVRDDLSEQERQKLLDELHNRAPFMQMQQSDLPFLPLSALGDGSVLYDVLKKPIVMIVVRPNWDVRDIMGTHLNVSHLGFLLPDTEGYSFFHASSRFEKVTQETIADYLDYCRTIPSVAGMHFLAIDRGG